MNEWQVWAKNRTQDNKCFTNTDDWVMIWKASCEEEAFDLREVVRNHRGNIYVVALPINCRPTIG